MGVARDVLVQRVHELPATVLAEHLQPARHIEEAGARRVRVRHDQMVLVNRIGQILPRGRHRQAQLARLDGVVADRGDPGVHPDPGWWVAVIDKLRIQQLDADRRVGLQHALGFHQQQRGCGQAPDQIGLRIVLLRQQLGGDDAGRVTHPVDLDVRVLLVEGLGIALEILGLDGGVDGEFRLRHRVRGDEQAGGDCAPEVFVKAHDIRPPCGQCHVLVGSERRL